MSYRIQRRLRFSNLDSIHCFRVHTVKGRQGKSNKYLYLGYVTELLRSKAS